MCCKAQQDDFCCETEIQLYHSVLKNMMTVIWLATNFLSHALSLRLLNYHLAFSDMLTNCPVVDK